MNIKITEKATTELREIIKQSSLNNPALRIQFEGFG